MSRQTSQEDQVLGGSYYILTPVDNVKEFTDCNKSSYNRQNIELPS